MTSATSSSSARPAPVLSDWRPLGARFIVIAAAAGCAAAGVTPYATAPLAGLALVLVFEAVAGRASVGPLDSMVLTVGGLLVVAVLAGLVLDIIPGGLDRTSWAVAAGLCESAMVAWARPGALRLPFRLFDLSPYVAGAALIAIGLVLATVAEDHADLAPVALASTAGPVGAPQGEETVTVTSGTSSGPMTLVVDDPTGSKVLAVDFTVAAHHARSADVRVGAGQRVTVRLLQGPTSAGATLRTLILVGP
jgi:hypothetical protein